jgi:hypothetical protein
MTTTTSTKTTLTLNRRKLSELARSTQDKLNLNDALDQPSWSSDPGFKGDMPHISGPSFYSAVSAQQICR